ncbi:MAG: S-DNA-T family DNA segregation ATPase FtsK/SpoIIIE [Alphaproteobacteria bacterium]|jgi:S-DNA-T family DNA segregation ATPase FtsK/SpoIIIE
MIARAHNGPMRRGSTRGRLIRGFSNRMAFLPEPLRNFIRRRFAEGFGLLVIAAGVAFAIALIGYDSLDASLNNATGAPVHNPLGFYGAVTSDLALQYFGLAVALPVIVLLAWGVRLFRHRSVPHFGWRLLTVLVSICAAAFALNAVATPAGWSIRTGLGGTFGHLAFDPAIEFLSGYEIAPSIPVGVTAVVALVGLLSALALNWSDWRMVSRILGWAGRRSSHATCWVAYRGAGAARTGTAGLGAGVRAVLKRRAAARHEPQPIRSPRVRREPSARVTPAAPIEAQRQRVAPRAKAPKPSRQAQADRQAKLKFSAPGEVYELPPLDLLAEIDERSTVSSLISEEALEQNARVLESVLEDFGVYGEIVHVRPGPVVTLYELEPAPGTKTSRVIGLADDIARSMSAVSVRIAVVPGRNVIGIELPNTTREHVALRELLAASSFEKKSMDLTLALGKDIGGEPVMVDLARMPHLLIAGTTGSGKSVGINAMIASLLYRLQPEECRFIMIDPKMLELSVYDGIPHLLAPVVTEPKKAVVALKWVTREMENRYRSMSKLGVRNLAGYNQRIEQARKKGDILSRKVQTGFDLESGKPVFEEQPFDMVPLPFIVVVVDEMADLMLVAGKEVEAAVQRLAQMARAAGIHLILATQRPSVDVITGTIKANLPTRISFQVTTKIDSRTILGEQGAEQLLGHGDMLYMAGGGRITRVHGPFVSDTEVESLVAFLKAQGEPDYIDDVTEDDGAANGLPGFDPAGDNSSGDELYDQAVALVAREQKASTSFVQRHLQIGYNRAARIIEQMEKEGVVSTANHVGRRDVLVADHGGD